MPSSGTSTCSPPSQILLPSHISSCPNDSESDSRSDKASCGMLSSLIFTLCTLKRSAAFSIQMLTCSRVTSLVSHFCSCAVCKWQMMDNPNVGLTKRTLWSCLLCFIHASCLFNHSTSFSSFHHRLRCSKYVIVLDVITRSTNSF